MGTTPQSNRPIISYQDERCCLGYLREVAIYVWFRTPDVVGIDRGTDMARQLSAQYPDGIYGLHLIDLVDRRAVSQGVLAVSIEALKRLRGSLCGLVCVLEGENAGRSIARAALSTILMATPYGFPTKIVPSVAEGAAWVAGRSSADPAGLLEATRYMRGIMK